MRDLFRGYYLADQPKMWGVDWLHHTPCGMVDGKYLQHIVFDKSECPDTLQQFQEMFDLPAGVADRVAEMLSTDPQVLMASLTPHTIAVVMEDMAAGYTFEEILERQIGIIVPEYVGRYFIEVVDRLAVVPVDDGEGNLVMPIMWCSQEIY